MRSCCCYSCRCCCCCCFLWRESRAAHNLSAIWYLTLGAGDGVVFLRGGYMCRAAFEVCFFSHLWRCVQFSTGANFSSSTLTISTTVKRNLHELTVFGCETVQVSGIKHYPPADFEPAASDLARFLWPGESWTQGRQRLLLGNGKGRVEGRVGGRRSRRRGAFKAVWETLPCAKHDVNRNAIVRPPSPYLNFGRWRTGMSSQAVRPPTSFPVELNREKCSCCQLIVAEILPPPRSSTPSHRMPARPARLVPPRRERAYRSRHPKRQARAMAPWASAHPVQGVRPFCLGVG